MDFIDDICTFSKKIPTIAESIKTEEATKTALVMPFIQMLGYNVFDPTEVCPEFVADVGIKKGEKVDYCIYNNGEPTLLFEVKPVYFDLSTAHASQLYRYFTVTPARIGILTNGVVYKFFTDLDKPNTMDERPFLEINLLEPKESSLQELKKFTKAGFNLEDIDSVASELKYTREIKQILLDQSTSPTPEFVKFFAKPVYGRPLMPSVMEKFTPIVKTAFAQFINERINDRLKSAMAPEPAPLPVEPISDVTKDEPDIITTAEELESYYIIKAIVRESVDPSKITLRDAKSYCAILYENNNRKPICRLYYNSPKKKIGLFDSPEGTEERIPLGSPDDLFTYASRLRTTVEKFTTVKQ
ncbi:type I restriction endonuclease [Methanosphaerula palustris]|uniref:Restriction endonuclease type I HsdR N-terminal domain-containing protein n=1 Tax=Methanosphaerula palustris (strain ATCC BAA-1556 / DSM 19958 / E1-9c) TaxID=521011 RepID=B8GHJ8_METPE|nr:type I restriction endonuclease [Methanosphaerula palustris]ACL16603.1 protein of unknown function DUF450 [Methanosphaerula palustris E1-9c]